jgi:hypothetical protein
MKNVSVVGLGMVSKVGDTKDLEQLLTSSRLINPNVLTSGHTLSLDIPDDFNLSQQLLRRMSHFAKISLLSACNAIKNSGLDICGKSVGIIQGSVYGPIISGIQAFDDLIDFGDNQLSPTNFSGSVFNTSATYLSLAFGIQGPTLSHTSGLDTLYNSLLTASLWLESGEVDYVMMGIGDEYTTYFDHDFLTLDQQTGLLPTCEGWTTFILSKDETAKYGKIAYGYLKTLPETKSKKNIYSVWHQQIKTAEFLEHAKDNQACFPAFLRGSYPSASAFDLALALICTKNERFPMYNTSDGNYHIQFLSKDERISCYSIAENNGVVCYEIFKD